MKHFFNMTTPGSAVHNKCSNKRCNSTPGFFTASASTL